MGINTVVVPKRNKKDLDELPKYVKAGMNFVIVDTVGEVLKTALLERKGAKSSRAKSRKKKALPKAKSAKKTRIVKTKNEARSNRRVKTSQKSKRKV
jgi:ATP-dependent Lon protease